MIRPGCQTPDPVYPLVQLPDRTLMNDGLGGFLVVESTFLSVMGFNLSDALDISALPSTPADGTLIREMDHPEVFIVFRGAKFWIPNPATLFTLGFDWSQVKVIPDGGTTQLVTMPIDETLLREQHGPKVFLVDNSQLRWVTSPVAMDARRLPWRDIRIVPDNALVALTLGPPI